MKGFTKGCLTAFALSLFVSNATASLYDPSQEFKTVYSCVTLGNDGKEEPHPMFKFWFHIHSDGETTTLTDQWFTYTSYKDIYYPATYNREPTTTVMVSAKRGSLWRFAWVRLYPNTNQFQSREIEAELNTWYKKGKLKYTSRDKLTIEKVFKCEKLSLE